MATQVQFRRGTTGQHSAFTGAVGEVTVDTEKKTACIHDASTIGGFPLLKEDGTNSNFALGSLSSCALKFAGDPNTGLFSPGSDQLHPGTGATLVFKPAHPLGSIPFNFWNLDLPHAPDAGYGARTAFLPWTKPGSKDGSG